MASADVPAIMFERHYFSRLTNHQYDSTHPDISWPTGYRTKKKLGNRDAKMSDGKVEQDDVYSSYASSYLRLINAYRINPAAALKSCSWGKFQPMGDEWNTCGATKLAEFMEAVCTSEVKQLDLLRGFIRNKTSGKLWKAVKEKNWENIALYYNGTQYKKFHYDTKLQAAYEELATHA